MIGASALALSLATGSGENALAEDVLIDRAIEISDQLCVASFPEFQEVEALATAQNFSRAEDDEFTHFLDTKVGEAIAVTVAPAEKILGLTLSPPQCIVSLPGNDPQKVLEKLEAFLLAEYGEVKTPILDKVTTALTVDAGSRTIVHPELGGVQFMIIEVPDQAVIGISVMEPI